MASRLSEDPNVTVLLVEAGGYFNWLSSIPLAAPALQKTHVDWGYKTETQAFSSKGLWDHVRILPFYNAFDYYSSNFLEKSENDERTFKINRNEYIN